MPPTREEFHICVRRAPSIHPSRRSVEFSLREPFRLGTRPFSSFLPANSAPRRRTNPNKADCETSGEISPFGNSENLSGNFRGSPSRVCVTPLIEIAFDAKFRWIIDDKQRGTRVATWASLGLEEREIGVPWGAGVYGRRADTREARKKSRISRIRDSRDGFSSSVIRLRKTSVARVSVFLCGHGLSTIRILGEIKLVSAGIRLRHYRILAAGGGHLFVPVSRESLLLFAYSLSRDRSRRGPGSIEDSDNVHFAIAQGCIWPCISTVIDDVWNRDEVCERRRTTMVSREV